MPNANNSDTEISNDLVVEIHYTLTDSDGKELDSSKGNGPLAYLHGKQNIIPGLENELTGKKVGDTFNVTIPASEAYGDREHKMIQSVPKSEFKDPSQIQLGIQFEAQNGYFVTIIKIENDHVVVDGNHPFAGLDLTFDVEVVGIREATETEVASGHVSG